MPNLFFADLVRERCHDGGAGPLTPTGAMPGHRRFADAVPVGASFHYAVAGVAWSAEWENGTGHIDEAGRLVRDSVAASSNGGAPVDFALGLKTIALTVGAAWFAGQQADAAATAGALAGKQPLSTGHAAAANGAEGDVLTVRRGEGWVNIPLSTLAWRDGAGRMQAGAPLACADGTAASPSISFAADTDTGIFRSGVNMLGFAVGGNERITVNSTGSVVVKLRSDSVAALSLDTERASGAGGVMLRFRDAAGIKGSIGYSSSTDAMYVVNQANADLTFSTNNAARMVLQADGALRPAADNVYPLGQAAHRWSVVYAGTGTINTSDSREKTWRGAMTEAELAAARRIVAELGFYQWNEAIAEKGPDGARLHFGVRAQAVWAVMADEGLIDPLDEGSDPSSRYAFLCWDKWEAEGAASARFGLRPDELALFLIAAQEARIAALEAAA